MKDPLNILFVSSEVVPFAKRGGLADVAGALPKALQRHGHSVIVVMPKYQSIETIEFKKLPYRVDVPMGSMGILSAELYTTTLPNSNVPIYFMDYEDFYGRNGLYEDEDGIPYEDNDSRFIFLSKSAFQLAKKLEFKPDIIHANDWHTASIPALNNANYNQDEHFKDSVTILTIHDIEHQGGFLKDALDVLETGGKIHNVIELELEDNFNMLKDGTTHADAITTVSEKYSKEIQSAEFGFGLQDHIWEQSYKLFGILNGVDYDEWSPAIDPLIAAAYDIENMDGKRKCKSALLEELGLPELDLPLVGYIGPFTKQKGVELIAAVMEGMIYLEAQYIFLGTGEKHIEELFAGLATRYPDKFAVRVGYDNPLAHKIEAGCDLFLMPSLFEPCGLSQIYSLRYGTLPIVRATGGLDDTIDNYDPESDSGNGFKFEIPTEDRLFHTVERAINLWHNEKEAFRRMQIRAMKARFSWSEAAKSYEAAYYWAIENR